MKMEECAEPEGNVPDEQAPIPTQVDESLDKNKETEKHVAIATPAESNDAGKGDGKTEEAEKNTSDELKVDYKKLKHKYKKAKKEIEEYKTKHKSVESELGQLKEQTEGQTVTIKKLQEQIHNNVEDSSRTSSGADLKEKAKQADGLKLQANYLTRQVMQTQETETYLREKLAEALENKEESERKMKDLQVRLKRFIKDDQAKDERISKMEDELKEITQQVELLEQYVDEEQVQKIRKEAGSSARSNGESISVMSGESKSEKKSSACTLL